VTAQHCGVLRRRPLRGHHPDVGKNTITFDFSNLPGDVALLLSQQQHTHDLANDLAVAMRLDHVGAELLHQEMIGAVAEVVQEYLDHRPVPST
jgi:hypothetical protein